MIIFYDFLNETLFEHLKLKQIQQISFKKGKQ